MGRKNRNGRGRNAGMKGRAKRFAGEFLPNEILRDLRGDLKPAERSSMDDGWDDDLNIEVIEVRPRGAQNRQDSLQKAGNPGAGNNPAQAAGMAAMKATAEATADPAVEATADPSAKILEDHAGGSIPFTEKIRLFKKCLVEKPLLFVLGFVFLVIIVWLLTAPEIPGITDRAGHREKQTEKTETTEALMETVSVSRAGAETDSAKRDPGKTDSAAANREETAPVKAESERHEKPEETSERKEKSRPSSSETESAKVTDTMVQNPVPETENWKEKIFGSDHGLVQDKQVFITGLSASEKEKLSFRESDFVKAVSSFLSSKRIDAKTVEFLRKMDISADGAQEYLASLPGHDDFYLVVLMYPEYPGKYILSFLDLDGLAGSVEEKKKQESATENPIVNTPVQTVQTQPVSVSTPVQTQTPAQTQNTSPEEAKYDATDLTIMAVPSTLSNYLDNRYELQYTLYDYLYRNGKQNVGTAAVRDFGIDPDRRVASITFELDDGSTVIGSYKKDSNSYDYTS